MKRVLVLAGTAEARRVLARARDAGLGVVASLAGRTEAPDLGVPTRVGGFGGEAGFRDALADVSAVLDATHPFASRITARAVRVCDDEGVPYLRLTRPAWPSERDWACHRTEAECAAALAAQARVLLTTGPGSLAPFLGRVAALWCRRIDPAPAVPGVTWVVGRPPFAQADEDALLASLGITHLVTKNSGGARAKLDAAHARGVAVHVIDRPPNPGGEETHDIDAAFDFLRRYSDHP